MPPKSGTTEQSPLVDDWCDHVTAAYGTKSHGKFAPCTYGVSQVITDYEPLKFSSFRVFFAVRGTILQDSVLLIEQVLITLIFFGAALPVYIYFNADSMGDTKKDDMSIRKWLDSQEGRMREFAMIMTFLSSLLLAFYTTMAVARWWVIRTAGVGGIKAAEMELTMMISQMVTQEAQVLDAIRRYARASFMLIFLWRRKKIETAKQDLTSSGLLTNQEVDALMSCRAGPKHACLHEVIWAWQSAIVFTLYQQKKIKSEQLFRQLLESCSNGRMAVQVIHTHLAVRIPMQYVHLLGFLVKMHNLVLAIIMGALFGAAVRNGETIICCQLFGRTLILPLLFNAILLINAELSDPFDGHPTDFPGHAFSNDLEKTGKSFVAAYQNMPDWMAQRSRMPV